jgi:hypothetical protein
MPQIKKTGIFLVLALLLLGAPTLGWSRGEVVDLREEPHQIDISIRGNIVDIGTIKPAERLAVLVRNTDGGSRTVSATRVGNNYGHYRLVLEGVTCSQIGGVWITLDVSELIIPHTCQEISQ